MERLAVRKVEVKVEQVPLASLKAYDGNAGSKGAVGGCAAMRDIAE